MMEDKVNFDAVNALNFLVMHKDSMNTELYLKVVEVLRKSEYQILIAVMPKMAPVLLQSMINFTIGVSINEWNVLRRFRHFLDFIVHEWVPVTLPLSELAIIMLVSTLI